MAAVTIIIGWNAQNAFHPFFICTERLFPAGLRAMRTMADAHGRDGRASDAMLLFLVLNTTSVQLLPTTMIALRAQAGSASPADIVLPTLLVTAAATGCGVALCRLYAARKRGRRR